MNPTPHLPGFVYGTLRTGEENYSRYLEGRARGELPETTAGELYFIASEGYPFLTAGEGMVRGS
ncbi:MAG TPA: gamma-glutamylcyclotransferase [Desulfuromonadales bacterium]|nr:gamma-glutamylcyclotransferase [Desulfuromonadales bacterium]